MTQLANSIYKTLAFFDAQDLALTLLELSNYLVAPSPGEEREGQQAGVRLYDMEKVILNELAHKIGHKDGFYFLRGREELLKQRRYHYQTSLVRFRKAKKYLWFLRFIPYLRAVALSGSQALLNSNELSDIDLFVITKKNRIWLSRLLLSFYFQLLGQRRYGKHVANRFCLNHYLSEGLEISQDQNLYTAVEYASLIPVLGAEELQGFWARNPWLGKFLAEPTLELRPRFFNFQFGRLQRPLEIILDFTLALLLNWLSGIYQKRRIKMQEHILVSDDELSFHPGSRGQKVLVKFYEKIRA